MSKKKFNDLNDLVEYIKNAPLDDVIKLLKDYNIEFVEVEGASYCELCGKEMITDGVVSNCCDECKNKHINIDLVKCDHCGLEVSKNDATLYTWEEFDLLWYYCKECNKRFDKISEILEGED